MARDIDMAGAVPRFPLPSFEKQADLAERYRVETLLFCPNPWTLLRVFINLGDSGYPLQSLGLSVLWAAQSRCMA